MTLEVLFSSLVSVSFFICKQCVELWQQLVRMIRCISWCRSPQALHGHGWCDEGSGFSKLVTDTGGVKGAMGTGDVYLIADVLWHRSAMITGEGLHRQAMHAGAALPLYTVAEYEALGLLMGIFDHGLYRC